MNKQLDNINIIFECISGSHSYGLNTPESDIDYRGIFVPSLDKLISPLSDNPMQFVFKDPDRTLFSLYKYITLATDANPNILELMFIDDEFIIKDSPGGKILRENRNLFLSAKCFHTYTGYAHSQLNRVKHHREWFTNPIEKPEVPNHNKNILSNQMIKHLVDGFRDFLIQHTTDNALEEFERRNISCEVSILKEIYAKSFCDLQMKLFREYALKYFKTISKQFIKDDMYPILQDELEYHFKLNEWKQYQTWKNNRNEKRAELEKKYQMDTKHCSHLVRLFVQGKEILTKGTLTVNVGDNKDIWAVKNGEWTYDYLINWANDMESELSEIYKNKKYVIPHKPDRKEIEKVYLEILDNSLI